MSDLGPYYARGMKKLLRSIIPTEGAIVAIFGGSKLVRKGWSKFDIHGGSPEEQQEASEWMSLFLHGVNVQEHQTNQNQS